MKRNTILWISLLLNLLLFLGLWAAVQRLGGWTYAMYRLRQDQAGLYEHRKQLFERLPTQTGAIIFLGDSQTEQCEWRELLHLDSTVVLNRGITGDHVSGILARVDEIVRHQPSKIFILAGINDLIFGKKPEAIAATYQEIIAAIRTKSPDSELFLQSVLPVNNTIKNIGVTNETIQDLNRQIAGVAKDYALPYLDIYTELTDAGGNLSPQFTTDGIHLNGLGYMAWKNYLRKQVML